MDLYELLAKEKAKLLEEKERREKELERQRKIKEDKEAMYEEFDDAEMELYALEEYKFFIEKIYGEFIKNIIATGGEKILDPDTIKGTITINYLDDIPVSQKESGIHNGIDGLISYALKDGHLSLFVNSHGFVKFTRLMNSFLKRFSLSEFPGASETDLNCPMEKLVESYYTELQAVPILDERIQQLSEDYNIDLGEDQQGKKM